MDIYERTGAPTRTSLPLISTIYVLT